MENNYSNNSNLTKFFGWLKRYQFIANWIIALIAIGGFSYSIYTSGETSKQVKLAIDTFTTPTIILGDIEINRPKDAPKSCKYPPAEIIFLFKNPTYIPVQIIDYDVKIWWGEIEIKPTIKYGAEDKEKARTILIEGEPMPFVWTLGKDMQERLSRSKDMWKPPYIKSQAHVIFSRVNSEKRYKYETVKIIGYDCTRAKFRVQDEYETSCSID